jgi:hypothetical protein
MGITISALIEKTKRMYYTVTGYEPVDVRIEVVPDIVRRCIELAHSEEEKKRYEDSKNTLAALKGTIVWPERLSEPPAVLIHEKTLQRDENGIFYSTLTHELTHVHDYYAFAGYFGYHDPKAVQEDRRFTVFYFWTEFHARRTGYDIYRMLMLEWIPQTRREQIRHIQKEECPFQLESLDESLKEYVGKGAPLLYMYSLVQFFARYSVWNERFPRAMGKKAFPRELTDVFGKKAADLCAYLHTHQAFESFIAEEKELEHLINAFTVDFEEGRTLYPDRPPRTAGPVK